MESETPRDDYQAKAFCTNCAYEGSVTAPLGTYVYEQPCPLCTCKALKPVAMREWNTSLEES